ncbi:hypothetical protein B0H34DRAFT_655941, partial [Crassisporium funariophilum]
GPMLIGFTFNVLLLGILMTQLYLYYTHYKRDKLWIKLFVAAIFVANIVNTVFDLIYLYRVLIINFGEHNTYIPDCHLTQSMLQVLIVLAVQSFFAWRTFALTKKWYWPVLIIAIAIASAVGGILTPVEFVKRPTFATVIQTKGPIILWLASGVVCDILITGVLVWYLHQHKTGFPRSDMIVDRIIRLTVQTGMLTSTLATVDMIVFLADWMYFRHLIFNFPLAKLYSNSLMSSLNSRHGWQYEDTTNDPQVVSSISKLRHQVAASNTRQVC